MTEDARWDYRVTIKFKNSTVATTADTDEQAAIKRLWPDQETYKREEQRRFEILLAHWDLPVTEITPAKKKPEVSKMNRSNYALFLLGRAAPPATGLLRSLPTAARS